MYVLASWGQPNFDCTGDSGCQASFTVTIYQPPSTLETEMPEQWYVYLGPGSGSGQSSQALTLDPNAVIGAARQIASDEYTRTVSFSYDGASPSQRICFKDTKAQDGTGLPNATGCGAPTVPGSGGYLG